MALELKGLRLKASKVTANIDRLNAAYDRFNELAPAHAADVEGLTPQIAQLGEDLTFAATMLGNSVNGSADSQPRAVVSQIEQAAVQQPEAQPANPAPPQPVPNTFRAEAEQQIAAGQKL